MDRQTLTIAEAADFLGISLRTAERLIAAGEFPVSVVRVGRKRLVSRKALEAFIDGQAVAS